MPGSHGLKLAYFHCGPCGEFKAPYSDWIDQAPTWRCGCGDLATFLGWGEDGKAAYEQAKRNRETRREQVARDESKRITDEDRRASTLAASVLEAVRTSITVGRGGLKSQTSRDRFDRIVQDGLRQMIGEE